MVPGGTRRHTSDTPEPGPGQWTLQVYEPVGKPAPYVRFVERLDGWQRHIVDIAVRTILAHQGHNVCQTEWGKSLGKGLYEFRIRRTLRTICSTTGTELPTGVDPDREVLLRVFFAVEGDRIVLLLGGYDKGADPSDKRQEKAIKQARMLLTQHRQRRPRGRR